MVVHKNTHGCYEKENLNLDVSADTQALDFGASLNGQQGTFFNHQWKAVSNKW